MMYLMFRKYIQLYKEVILFQVRIYYFDYLIKRIGNYSIINLERGRYGGFF